MKKLNIPGSSRDLLESIVQDGRKERLKSVLSQRTRHITLVLEDVYHPHNTGAVIRTAECFGIQDVHIIENRNTFNVKKTSVSMGAKKWVHQHYWCDHDQDNTTLCLSSLKQKGYRVAVTILEEGKSIPLTQLPIEEPLALVIGAEKMGVSQTAQALADYKIMISMYGFTQSLNLSVCAAICLYELTGKLKASKVDWALPDQEQEHLYVEWIRKSVARPDRYHQK